MRTLLILASLALAAPAVAQSWPYYENARFGYDVDIPPDFEGQGESDNGDGELFTGPGSAEIAVWGGFMMEASFEAEAAAAQALAEGDAWNITYQATTPSWSSFSGIKGIRILYQRMVQLCDGASYAAFRADYPVTQSAAMEPVIKRMVRSLKPTDC